MHIHTYICIRTHTHTCTHIASMRELHAHTDTQYIHTTLTHTPRHMHAAMRELLARLLALGTSKHISDTFSNTLATR
jgi:hypothetical protein